MKFGIEFEMSYGSSDADKFNLFVKNIKSYGNLTHDGSLRTPNEIRSKTNHDTKELVTKPFKSISQFKKYLDKCFINPKGYTVNINEDKGADVIVYFNKSTGTHIHLSTKQHKLGNRSMSYPYPRTLELLYLYDEKYLRNMYKFIRDNCKYDTIKKDFRRMYSYISFRNISERYNAINVGNAHQHGTIEFRLFNLHGVTTEQFSDALLHQINLMLQSVLRQYKYIIRKNKTYTYPKILDEFELTDRNKLIDSTISNTYKEHLNENIKKYNQLKVELPKSLKSTVKSLNMIIKRKDNWVVKNGTENIKNDDANNQCNLKNYITKG